MSIGLNRSEAASPWVVRYRRVDDPGARLFCFPYAGGGASVYHGWEALLPGGVELCVVQPPGRESRLFDAPIRRIEPMVEAAREALAPYLDRPFSFFGHSMGCYVAFELAHALRARGGPEPRHLFLSAGSAPHFPDDEPPLHPLPDDEFLVGLRERYDGIPRGVLESEELLKLVLPCLKADLELVETYEHRAAEPLDVALFALGGTEDDRVSEEELLGWSDYTRGPFEMRRFPGNHFFLQAQREALLQLIGDALRTALRESKQSSDDRGSNS